MLEVGLGLTIKIYRRITRSALASELHGPYLLTPHETSDIIDLRLAPVAKAALPDLPSINRDEGLSLSLRIALITGTTR